MQSRLQWGLQVHAVIPLQSYNPSFRGDLHGSGLIRQPCVLYFGTVQPGEEKLWSDLIVAFQRLKEHVL